MYPTNVQRMLAEKFIGKSGNEEDSGNDERVESAWLAKKREIHTGAYMPWTEEDKKLTNEFKRGQFSTHDLSEIHGRTVGAIRARLRKLKLIEQ